MSNPTNGNVMPDNELRDIAIAYFQDENKAIAKKAMPTYQVEYEAGRYNKMPKEYLLRTDFEARADGANFVETEFKFTEDTYACIEYSAEKVLGDRILKNSKFNLKAQATKLLATQALIKRDRLFQKAYLAQSIWGTDMVGVANADDDTALEFTKFSDYEKSDPILVIANAKLDMEAKTGFKPNKLVITRDVEVALLNHPDILARMSTNVIRIANTDLLAQLFDVDEVYVAGVIENTAKVGGTAAIDFQAKGQMLLYYSPEFADMWTPTAGMVFVPYASEENELGVHVFTGRDERRHAEYIQMQMFFDMKIVCSDLGIYFYNVI